LSYVACPSLQYFPTLSQKLTEVSLDFHYSDHGIKELDIVLVINGGTTKKFACYLRILHEKFIICLPVK
jgi:hypothetical protein